MPLRWFPLSITQQTLTGGFKITLTTDVACFLYLYWTNKAPWTHRTVSNKRGLLVPWDAYWCFVTWTLIAQEEPTDSLTHTFIWPAWEICQTKYFRFHGTIAGNTSPSDSPIFKKHYAYDPTAGNLKESFHLDGVPDIYGVIKPRGVGYSFIAASSYTLNHIVAWFTVRPNVLYLDVALYKADDTWHPIGSPLAQAAIDGTGLNPWPHHAPKSIPLSGAPIVAGQKYAVTMLNESTDWDEGWMSWWRAGANPHRIITTLDQGITWVTKAAGSSLAFENWGT